jgi:hypothetical protein
MFTEAWTGIAEQIVSKDERENIVTEKKEKPAKAQRSSPASGRISLTGHVSC